MLSIQCSIRLKTYHHQYLYKGINYLKKKLKGKSKNIKNYLLDQKFVSGIGNIYANEILFFCKINK